MKKATFIVILISALSILAQYTWSDRVLITSHPTAQIRDQNMFIDINGTIHVIWNEIYEHNLSQIFYSCSYDTGDTWSVPFNVSQSDISELGDPAVGADCDGNLFVTYSWNSLGYPIMMQKKFDGTSWSEPARLDSNSVHFPNWYLNDHDGRTYHFWRQFAKTKYRYKEKNSLEWSEINYSIYDLFISDIALDDNNNLHCTGSKEYISGEDTRAIYIKYDKENDNWVNFVDLDSNYSGSHKICISKDHYIHVVLRERDYNQTYFTALYVKKSLSDSLWTEPEIITGTLDPLIIFMTTDANSYPHIFMYFPSAWGIAHEYIKEGNGLWHYNLYYSPNTGSVIKLLNDTNLGMLALSYEDGGCNLLFLKSTGVGIHENEQVILDFQLQQNYPNPFNSETIIEYQLRNDGEIKIDVYNSKGEFVDGLVNQKVNKGKHSATFDASKFNSGIYYYQFKINGKVEETKKMLYLR